MFLAAEILSRYGIANSKTWLYRPLRKLRTTDIQVHGTSDQGPSEIIPQILAATKQRLLTIVAYRQVDARLVCSDAVRGDHHVWEYHVLVVRFTGEGS